MSTQVNTSTRSILAQARQIHDRKQYPGVRRMLGAFTEECPACGRGRNDWQFDFGGKPPISEGSSYDRVRYVCTCGCRFSKLEATE